MMRAIRLAAVEMCDGKVRAVDCRSGCIEAECEENVITWILWRHHAAFFVVWRDVHHRWRFAENVGK